MNYKKKTKITVLITTVLAVAIIGSAFAFGALSSFEIGVFANKIEQDARKSQKISEWEVSKSINENLCAMLFYNDAQDAHTFSIYVKGNGLRFGYFFRVGGSSSMIAEGIDEFSFDLNGSAILSMNKNRVARIEIDNGTDITIIDIDSEKPFAIVIPNNSGSVTLYNDNGNVVKVNE